MPSKYLIRNFEENSYYHVFNRGVEKRKIFIDLKDYKIFIYYLFIYLKPISIVLSKYPELPLRLQSKNLSAEVSLISFCLMPNHFHLLLRQNTKNGISKLMKQITNAYTEYFNKRNKRVGSLMQGPFKAVKISTDEQLIHLSRYIHLNPLVGNVVNNLDKYQWSSFASFFSEKNSHLCDKKIIKKFFRSTLDYKKFVLDQASYSKELKNLEGLTIEA